MNTCKSYNPNMSAHPTYDTSSIAAYFWDLSLSGFCDYVTYDCDDSECDHEYCNTIDVFKITRADRLLFDDLADISELLIWKDSQGFINTLLIDDLNPMPVYALGL